MLCLPLEIADGDDWVHKIIVAIYYSSIVLSSCTRVTHFKSGLVSGIPTKVANAIPDIRRISHGQKTIRQ